MKDRLPFSVEKGVPGRPSHPVLAPEVRLLVLRAALSLPSLSMSEACLSLG